MNERRAHTHTAPPVPAEALRALVDFRSRELGLTRDRLAVAAGVGRSTVFDWLSGTGQPSAAGWLGLAGALGMRVSELFTALGVDLTSPVERARLDRGWTRADLADAAGVSAATVRTLEGGGTVRADAAARIGAALGLEPTFTRGASRVYARAATPLGLALEEARLGRGWTIAELARNLGVARQLVSAWLLGAEPVADRWLPTLAQLVGVTPDQMADLAAASRASRPGRATATPTGSDTPAAVRAFREGRGWSRVEMAQHLSVSPASVEQWETGRRRPAGPARLRLEALLRS